MMFCLRKTQNPLLKKQRVLCFSVLSIWYKWERYFSYMRTPKVMRQKEEGIICRLMARSGRLPSGFDYTLIKIIINTKLMRNRKFNIINWKIIRFNGYCWQSWKEIEEDKPVSVWSIAIRKWSLSDRWGIRVGLDRAGLIKRWLTI